MNKSYVSEPMGAARICAHGQIVSLAGFSRPDGDVFSVYVRPKGDASASDVLINVRCANDPYAAPAPVPVGDWSPLAIVEIDDSNELLDDYDIYWGGIR